MVFDNCQDASPTRAAMFIHTIRSKTVAANLKDLAMVAMLAIIGMVGMVGIIQ